jgi:DNA-binding transcriptional MocR family regulator
LTLVAAVLLEPGDAVLVEDPSYLAALQAFQLAGARVVPVPCDDDGLDPGALAALVRRERPKLVYTVPTFHNPTGRTLPLERRAALAAAAGRLGLWIVEDDPYGELRYRGEPVAPVAALPGAEDRTIALSTLSKVLAPGLRIGWVRAPAPLRRSLAVAKQAADLHSSTVDQAAAARWLTTCDLDAHVARLRAAYSPRRDALVHGLADALPAGSRWTRPDGGMFVWVRLPDGWDADVLLRAALERDVAFVPGWPFYAGHPDCATLRLSFTTHTTQEIAAGLGRLAAAVTAVAAAAEPA